MTVDSIIVYAVMVFVTVLSLTALASLFFYCLVRAVMNRDRAGLVICTIFGILLVAISRFAITLVT